MALVGFQQEAVVRVAEGRDSTGEPSNLRTDDLLMGLANQGKQIQVNNASMVIPGAHWEGTPGGKGHWEVLRDPNAVHWGFTTGSVHEGGKCGEAWVCINDSLVEGVGTAESGEICLVDVTIHICHENNGIPSGLPRSKGGREVPEEGIMATGGITKGFQVVALLGVDCLEAGFLRYIGAVAANHGKHCNLCDPGGGTKTSGPTQRGPHQKQ